MEIRPSLVQLQVMEATVAAASVLTELESIAVVKLVTCGQKVVKVMVDEVVAFVDVGAANTLSMLHTVKGTCLSKTQVEAPLMLRGNYCFGAHG